jgi:dTDP-4-dehydrorhamnose 3,5-epimerase
MEILNTSIEGLFFIHPDVHTDDRGRFVESYRREWIVGGSEMLQSNRSEKIAGSLVGLHYHLHQADYWYVLRGTARVVLHDLRQGSPTQGVTLLTDANEHNDRGIYIPPGVAHGFAALTDLLLHYQVDAYYDPADELGLAFDDPVLGADWGVTDPVCSARDRGNPIRSAIPDNLLPRYR